MSKIKKTVILVSLILLLATAAAFSVSAEHYSIGGFEIPVDVLVNGAIIKTPVDAFLETDNNTVYVPVRAISDAVGAEVLWFDEIKTATVTKGDTTLSFSICDPITTAVIYKDTLFVPVRALSESFGYYVTWDGYYYQVLVSAPEVTVPAEYIDTSYYNDEILIVAQVLHCECRYSSFDGKIAVANVVTNRVANHQFPNTVHEVIYDRRYGSVQFTIAYDGKLNNTPTGECILAAKCALNGTVVAKDCLFYQSEKLTGSWMDKNREVAMCVGGNKFFY